MPAPPQVVFSPDVANLDQWANRTGLPLPTSAEALGTNYARAIKWFILMKTKLVDQHGWSECPTTDKRLLISLSCRSPYTTANGIQRTPDLSLCLPAHATSFFSPSRTTSFQMIFHSNLFATLRHSIPPISDILFLLQCLIPGMLTIVQMEQIQGEGLWTTTRALPPAEWVSANEQMLSEIFGHPHHKKLLRAASDRRIAFKTHCDPDGTF